MKRRDFMLSSAALPLFARIPFGIMAPGAPDAPAVVPFDLHQVRLLPGPFLDAMQVNRRFLLGLDPDRLLHNFRLTAGLHSDAEPLGGWEAPDNELRGHFVGHYLSACALLSASLGDGQAMERGALVVSGLAECQAALGSGYLSAFPEELFDRLRAGKPAWAPWYTLHKIMAGLLDMHTVAADPHALEVLRGMAGWTARWVEPLSADEMNRVLEREFGGMNELLYNLSAVTGSQDYAGLAHRFDHERIFAPLAEGRDELKGLHVNTTVPKIIGAARRYELTGDTRARRVADYFWTEVTTRRAYCTGGTSNDESWNADPGILSTELGPTTQECCVSYNLLKLSRHRFQWTADPAIADYYERLLFNGVLGTQHPQDGSKLYYVPLATGYWKLFGVPLHDFWCCTGSGSESFAKFGDSIYFHDDRGIYLNLFIASEVEWPDRGLRLIQETAFPEQQGSAVTIRTAKPQAMALRIRIPAWATGSSATVNGHRVAGFGKAGSYFVLDRTWHDGDRVELDLPMALHASPMPDDGGLVAAMYGPLVLVGRLGQEGLTPETIRAEPTKPRMVPEYQLSAVAAPEITSASVDPAQWLEPVAGTPLEFRTKGQATPITFSPFYQVLEERYGVYWRVKA
jgi:hypothetical protein